MTLKQRRGSIIPAGKSSSAIVIPKPIIELYDLENGDELDYEWDITDSRFIILLPDMKNGKKTISKNRRKIIELVKKYEPIAFYNIIPQIKKELKLNIKSSYIDNMIRDKFLMYNKERKIIIGSQEAL